MGVRLGTAWGTACRLPFGRLRLGVPTATPKHSDHTQYAHQWPTASQKYPPDPRPRPPVMLAVMIATPGPRAGPSPLHTINSHHSDPYPSAGSPEATPTRPTWGSDLDKSAEGQPCVVSDSE